VRLHVGPDVQTIRAGRGVLDYWTAHGAWYARKWPEHAPRVRSDAEVASSKAFSCVTQWSSGLSPTVVLGYINMRPSVGETWNDLFRQVGRKRSPYSLAFETV
jgi:hypothetical protein